MARSIADTDVSGQDGLQSKIARLICFAKLGIAGGVRIVIEEIHTAHFVLILTVVLRGEIDRIGKIRIGCPVRRAAKENDVADDVHVSNLAALSGEIEIVTDDGATFASVPLMLDGITFSVLEFRLARPIEDRAALLEKLGSLRRRISPMLLGIGDGEENESVAFTDLVTGLPNERT